MQVFCGRDNSKLQCHHHTFSPKTQQWTLTKHAAAVVLESAVQEHETHHGEVPLWDETRLLFLIHTFLVCSAAQVQLQLYANEECFCEQPCGTLLESRRSVATHRSK